MRLAKFIALLTLVTCCSHAQFSNTIFQQVFSNQAVVTTGVVSNIGQAFHTLSVTPRNQANCASGASPLRVGLEASNDGTNWARIATIHGSSTVVAIYTRTAIGAFPNLRVNIYNLPTNCNIDVAYYGTLFPGPTANSPTPTSFNGGLSGWQFPACLAPCGAGAGATGQTLLTNVNNSLGTDSVIAIYGMTVYNYSAGAETITIGGGNPAGACASGTIANPFVQAHVMPPGNAIISNLVFPNSPVPYFTTQPGQALCITEAANASNHNLAVFVTTKYE